MGSARLGGEKMTAVLHPFLRDPSWMMRTASLKIIAAFEKTEDIRKFDGAVMKALLDPALVVRAEAISTLERIKAPALEQALFDSLEEPSNYHRGIAQFVPQRALRALVKLPIDSKDVAKKRLNRVSELLLNDEFVGDAEFKHQLTMASQFFKKSTN